MYTSSQCAADERIIIRSIVTDAIARGCAVSVFDGGAYAIRRSVDALAVMAAIMTTGEDTLVFESAETRKHVGCVCLVYGNGCNVVADYSDNEKMQAIMANAEKLACDLAESNFRNRDWPY